MLEDEVITHRADSDIVHTLYLTPAGPFILLSLLLLPTKPTHIAPAMSLQLASISRCTMSIDLGFDVKRVLNSYVLFCPLMP